jgi:hypothetical protein
LGGIGAAGGAATTGDAAGGLGGIAAPVAIGIGLGVGIYESGAGSYIGTTQAGTGLTDLVVPPYTGLDPYSPPGMGPRNTKARNSAPVPYPQPVNPGRDPKTGGCHPCPPDSPPWYDPTPNQHGCPNGHYHWYHYNQLPNCNCIAKKMTSGNNPGGPNGPLVGPGPGPGPSAGPGPGPGPSRGPSLNPGPSLSGGI